MEKRIKMKKSFVGQKQCSTGPELLQVLGAKTYQTGVFPLVVTVISGPTD